MDESDESLQTRWSEVLLYHQVSVDVNRRQAKKERGVDLSGIINSW